MKPQSPWKFKTGDYVQSVYSNEIYSVIESDKNGMATLETLSGFREKWNACNNAHFVKMEGQLKLEF